MPPLLTDVSPAAADATLKPSAVVGLPALSFLRTDEIWRLFAEAPAVTVPVNVGDALSTTDPVPVEDVTPVPPLATGRVPVTPVVSGNPVAFVSVPLAGVPRVGVTNVGEVDSTILPVPVTALDKVIPP